MYVFFRKKNHSYDLSKNDFFSDLVHNLYLYLLRSTINKQYKELKIYKNMRDFIHNAYMEDINALNDHYLITTIQRLKYVCGMISLYKPDTPITVIKK